MMALCYGNITTTTKSFEQKFTQDLHPYIAIYMNKDDLFMVNHVSAVL